MKFFFVRFGLAKSLVALAVSVALSLSAPLAFGSPARSKTPFKSQAGQTVAAEGELRLTSAKATVIAGGVLVRWSTNSTPDNLGFNVYRVKDGQPTRVNREIIAGAVFGPGTPALMRGYSYSWFDRGGTTNSIYAIESVSIDGSARMHQQVTAVADKSASGLEELPGSATGTSVAESGNTFEKSFPAAESQITSPQGTLQQQWAIVAQPGLKIGIKKEGWYRVTQQQMVAAGFNPTVDIRNLRLFVDANEVAIATSQFTGTFSSGDYIEFYGRGLDIPTTDTRTYYLIAGTTPGKRVSGDIQLDSPPGDPPSPPVPPVPTSTPPTDTNSDGPLLREPIFYSWVQRDLSLLFDSLRPSTAAAESNRGTNRSDSSSTANATFGSSKARPAVPDYSQPEAVAPVETGAPEVEPAAPKASGLSLTVGGESAPVKHTANAESKKSLSLPVLMRNARSISVVTRAAGKARQQTASRKKTRRKSRRQFRQERSHALAVDGFAATNFASTVQVKDRGIYFSNLLNGDEENFFGAVISSPVTIPLQLPNPDVGAAASATLEFALQGVLNTFTNASHQVSVAFNGVTLGVVDFGPLDHPVRSFPIPAAQVLNGANSVKFTKTSTGEVCIVDYVKLTYPRLFKADSGSLKFSLLGSQTRTVEGFSVPTVRLIDYTDPLAVKIRRPTSEPGGGSYAITVPAAEPFTKDQRLLLAIPDGQFDLPASLAFNQPSNLNLGTFGSLVGGADFLIISPKDFVASVAPLMTKRQGEGKVAAVADIEDIYDEFSFGVHGPQAIKDFLSYAAAHWPTKQPHYVIFAGDASLDPRNYQGLGNFDFVPTKLIDATYSETASDDWLADFDNDGIADIPVGRLPVRTAAQATTEISKIVNFVPANVPQSALLVADDHTNPAYYYDFEVASDQLAALLPGTIPVQKVYRRSYGGDNCAARADIIAAFNSGKALVNYLGHGSVDIWAGACADPLPGDPNHTLPEFGSADAAALTNGNKLSFVVVLDCLNGYFQDQTVQGIAEALMNNPNGGSVAAFASSGLTLPEGPHEMSQQLYTLVYGAQPIALGDAIKIAKGATNDIDVRTTWIFFGDPAMKIR